MPTVRDLHVLTVPPGREVTRILPTLAEAMADRGPALLPVPADDPARTRILVEAMRPESPIDPSAALVVSTSGSDRKSTRLNSSHVSRSYAVFCLKKKQGWRRRRRRLAGRARRRGGSGALRDCAAAAAAAAARPWPCRTWHRGTCRKHSCQPPSES